MGESTFFPAHFQIRGIALEHSKLVNICDQWQYQCICGKTAIIYDKFVIFFKSVIVRGHSFKDSGLQISTFFMEIVWHEFFIIITINILCNQLVYKMIGLIQPDGDDVTNRQELITINSYCQKIFTNSELWLEMFVSG